MLDPYTEDLRPVRDEGCAGYARRVGSPYAQAVARHLHRMQHHEELVAVLLDLGPLVAVARVFDREGHMARVQLGGWLIAFGAIFLMVHFQPRDLDDKDRERLNSGVRSVLVKESFRPSDLVERIRRVVDGTPTLGTGMEAAS